MQKYFSKIIMKKIKTARQCSRVPVIGFVFLLFFMCAAYAQSVDQLKALAQGKRVTAKRISTSVTLDGKVTRAEWGNAERIDVFWVIKTDKILQKNTRAYLLYDSDNLYIGMSCFEADTAKLKTSATGRDGKVWEDDGVEIFIAENGSTAPLFQFIVSARNALFDGKNTGGKLDMGWNGGIQSAAQVFSDGYGVEVIIPFSDISSSPPRSGSTWKIKLCRNDKINVSHNSWPVTWAGYISDPPYWGDLIFE